MSRSFQLNDITFQNMDNANVFISFLSGCRHRWRNWSIYHYRHFLDQFGQDSNFQLPGLNSCDFHFSLSKWKVNQMNISLKNFRSVKLYQSTYDYCYEYSKSRFPSNIAKQMSLISCRSFLNLLEIDMSRPKEIFLNLFVTWKISYRNCWKGNFFRDFYLDVLNVWYLHVMLVVRNTLLYL